MRIIIATAFLSILFAMSAFSQSNPLNYYVLPILNIDTKIQSRGMGDVGVVSSGTNYQSAFNQNPALLAKAKHWYDAHANYMPLSPNVNGTQIFVGSVGGMLTLQDNQAIGLNFKYLNDQSISEVVITGTYAYNFLADNDYNDLMIGGSLKFLQSRFKGFTNFSGVGAAFDFGVNYSTTIELTDDNYVRWKLGAALTNLGGKFSYGENTLPSFIPTNVRFGTMLSYKTVIDADNSLTISAAYQGDKLGIPTPNTTDGNNNGIEDFLEQPVWSSFIGSFNDAQRNGEEAEEITHKLGAEARLNVESIDGYFAVRAGRFMNHINKGNIKYNTVGGTVGIGGFYVDIALQSLPNNVNYLGFGVGFQTFL